MGLIGAAVAISVAVAQASPDFPYRLKYVGASQPIDEAQARCLAYVDAAVDRVRADASSGSEHVPARSFEFIRRMDFAQYTPAQQPGFRDLVARTVAKLEGELATYRDLAANHRTAFARETETLEREGTPPDTRAQYTKIMNELIAQAEMAVRYFEFHLALHTGILNYVDCMLGTKSPPPKE